jgi:hypothetical protein
MGNKNYNKKKEDKEKAKLSNLFYKDILYLILE